MGTIMRYEIKLTPLQALNNLYAILCHYTNEKGVGGAFTKEDGCGYNASDLKEIINEALNVLKIIKEALEICEEDFFHDEETGIYFFIGKPIEKEKYDLLKEVLL